MRKVLAQDRAHGLASEVQAGQNTTSVACSASADLRQNHRRNHTRQLACALNWANSGQTTTTAAPYRRPPKSPNRGR